MQIAFVAASLLKKKKRRRLLFPINRCVCLMAENPRISEKSNKFPKPAQVVFFNNLVKFFKIPYPRKSRLSSLKCK